MNLKLTKIEPGLYEYKAGNREYHICRNEQDRERWDVSCLVDGLCDWQECTWAGLAEVREMIKTDLSENNCPICTLNPLFCDKHSK